MRELIKITTNEQGSQVVSARELHDFLGVQKHFTQWFEQQTEWFTENKDYTVFNLKVKNLKGGRPGIDYAITIDMAKELSMLSRTEKGKKAREYFIECEKQLKQQPQQLSPAELMAKALIAAQEVLASKDKQIQQLAPKAALMEQVLDCKELITFDETAKILQLPFGRNTLFKRLRDKGVLFKNKNVPKQEYVERGYFQLKEKYIPRHNHEGFMVITTLVTQKGLNYLAELFGVIASPKLLARAM